MAVPAFAAPSRIDTYLDKVKPAELFPQGERYGPRSEKAAAYPVYKGEELLGYAYLTTDMVDTTGYSGRPIDVVVGLSVQGAIEGAKLVGHHEPIVLVGIPISKVESFIQGYIGRNVFDPALTNGAKPPVDIVSGATVTVMVIGDSLLRSGRKLLHAVTGQAVVSSSPTRQIDWNRQEISDWSGLLGDGLLRRLTITVGEVNETFARLGPGEAANRPEPGPEDERFIELYAGLATIPTLGRSLLGESGYRALRERLKPGQQAMLIAARGRYSFKGSGYVRGGIFDRIEVIQNDSGFRFRDKNHQRLGSLAAADSPALDEVGLFIIPETMNFDPAQPWRLQLLVQRATMALEKSFVTFDLGYLPPEKYLAPLTHAASPAAASVAPSSTDEQEGKAAPLWQQVWQNRQLDILLTGLSVVAITILFFFQDMLVRRPTFYKRLRVAILLFTLVYLGWYAHAQLSVVNILTFIDSIRHEFRWDYFMLDPLLFLLWFSVAASLLFWGRGAFCGWLCPFGALQELLNRFARRLGIPRIAVPFAIHERFWALKYILFLAIFGLSLHSLSNAERLAEIEPFKTAIVLHFLRDSWFVVYALILLAASVFIERFFCRYLCPLGAALAIPGQFQMFNWLRRYRECGSPCQKCAIDCPVQAIHPNGRINRHECIQCLHCQILYHHTHACPVVVARLKKAERQAAATTSDLRLSKHPAQSTAN